MKTKNIILIFVLVLIIGAIGYFEIHKPQVQGKGESIALTGNEMTESPEAMGSTTILSMSTSTAQDIKADRTSIIRSKANKYPGAIEIVPGGGFINSDPFTLRSLVGKKVILVDFWTYSCINCQRTIPYLNAWYEKYKDLGLVIVGVHTPEFGFEKVYDNVVKGVKDLGITYPVVQDNNLATWNAYQNQYWPHEYLIDIDGFIIHDKIGEGGYDETEREIQQALKERAHVLGIPDTVPTSITNPKDVITMNASGVQSPETYFGSGRNEYLANGAKGVSGNQTLTIPSDISANALYLGGTWSFNSEYAESQGPSTIEYKYNSKNVYFVASAAKPVTIDIYQDGVFVKTMTVQENKLYSLINGINYGVHTIKIDVKNAGLDAYTFTFG